MRSINRNTLLASTFVHDDDDDDPSPAGGAMPVPAIIKDGSANDNAAARNRFDARVQSYPLIKHRIVSCVDEWSWMLASYGFSE